MPMLLDLEAEMARRSFLFFFEHFAWPVLQPATPFKNNWHISAIADHLTAIKLGQIQKLLINMPFRHLKSSLVSHAFPAWDAPFRNSSRPLRPASDTGPAP